MRRVPNGFTLIELIMVMVIIGVLAVMIVPRLNSTSFGEQGVHDGIKAALQHARHTAIAARRYVCVNVTPGSGSAALVELRMDATVPESLTNVACGSGVGSAVNMPAKTSDCAQNQICGSKGVNILGTSTAQVIFDPMGRSVNTVKTATSATINISNAPAIVVSGETGFVQ